MIAAPYFPISTPTPAWARLVEGDNNRVVHEIDGRGFGLIGGVTPQILIPYGETPSVISSAMVQSDAPSTANGFEGIGHSLQGFVRGPTGSPVKVYDNNILTNGDPEQWNNNTFEDYTRVSFVEQLPDNISPEWMKSVWFAKVNSGQTRFTNFEYRDHYARRYKRQFGPAGWNNSQFSFEIAQNFIQSRSSGLLINYLDTIVAPIAKGQAITIEISTYIIEAVMLNINAGAALDSLFGMGVKFTRTEDGTAEWWLTRSIPSNNVTIAEDLINQSERFIAKSSYRQFEVVVWALNQSGQAFSTLNFQHDGISFDVNIEDVKESGS